MSTKAPVALPAGACPDGEQLAAYIDGMLTPAERTEIERHLAGCAECREIVGDSAAAAADIGGDTVPRRSRAKVWVGVGTLLAAAAAVVIAVRTQTASPYYVPEMKALVEAVGTNRPTTGRLTGGFAYGPPPSPTRGGSTSARLEVLGAAERIRAAAEGHSAPADVAAMGIASLAVGDTARAVDELRRASRSGDPRMLSDFSAALLADAGRTGNTREIGEAVEAAERALKSPQAPVEAAFNLAAALEAAGSGRAADAWRDYLARDSSSEWGREARRHLDDHGQRTR